jgi:hypothetical protein
LAESKNSKIKNIENMAEILGILNEKNLSKDWLLGELRRHNVRSEAFATKNNYEILKSLKPKVIEKVYKILSDEDLTIKDVKTLTRTLHWFFIDIVASSDPNLSVKSQARKIYALNTLIERTDVIKNSELDSLVLLPTGDGMAIGFSDSPEKPLMLGIQLHKSLRKFNKTKKEKDRINIRIGIETGPVYFMNGLNNSQIFWGPGIINAKRIMDLCGPNNIFASERFAGDLKKLSEENKATMRTIGQFKIKHGEEIEIFNIFGKDFGNKTAPSLGKTADNYDLDKEPKFEYNDIKIKLEITDTKTMMTHHVWVWDVKCISNEPLDALFYSLGGDTDKTFSDLNVKIHDENGNDLKIKSIETEKPHEKEFLVALKKPIKKNQRRRITLEYDWEEPDRNFEYVLSSKSKKMGFLLSVPKDLKIKYRILKVDKELGGKIRDANPPVMKESGDRIEVSWNTKRGKPLQRYDAYRFQW